MQLKLVRLFITTSFQKMKEDYFSQLDDYDEPFCEQQYTHGSCLFVSLFKFESQILDIYSAVVLYLWLKQNKYFSLNSKTFRIWISLIFFSGFLPYAKKYYEAKGLCKRTIHVCYTSLCIVNNV